MVYVKLKFILDFFLSIFVFSDYHWRFLFCSYEILSAKIWIIFFVIVFKSTIHALIVLNHDAYIALFPTWYKIYSIFLRFHWKFFALSSASTFNNFFFRLKFFSNSPRSRIAVQVVNVKCNFHVKSRWISPHDSHTIPFTWLCCFSPLFFATRLACCHFRRRLIALKVKKRCKTNDIENGKKILNRNKWCKLSSSFSWDAQTMYMIAAVVTTTIVQLNVYECRCNSSSVRYFCCS